MYIRNHNFNEIAKLVWRLTAKAAGAKKREIRLKRKLGLPDLLAS